MRILTKLPVIAMLSLASGCHRQERAEREHALQMPTTPMEREACLSLLRNPGACFHVLQVDPDSPYRAGVRETARMSGRVVSGGQSCTVGDMTAVANMNYGFMGQTRGTGFEWCHHQNYLSDVSTAMEGSIRDPQIAMALTAGLTIAFNIGLAGEF